MKRKGNFGGIFAMALILVLTLVLSVGSVSAAEPTIVDSGNCGKDGNNVTWTLDSAGLLTISGTGEMADYESKTDSASGEEITTAPWGNQAKTAVTGDGVTGIGAAAFYGCSGLTSVTMGSKCVSRLLGPDRHSAPRQRDQHRGVCLFQLREPDRHRDPGGRDHFGQQRIFRVR